MFCVVFSLFSSLRTHYAQWIIIGDPNGLSIQSLAEGNLQTSWGQYNHLIEREPSPGVVLETFASHKNSKTGSAYSLGKRLLTADWVLSSATVLCIAISKCHRHVLSLFFSSLLIPWRSSSSLVSWESDAAAEKFPSCATLSSPSSLVTHFSVFFFFFFFLGRVINSILLPDCFVFNGPLCPTLSFLDDSLKVVFTYLNQSVK